MTAAHRLSAEGVTRRITIYTWVTVLCTFALIPAAIGRGIDQGLVADDPRALLTWSLVIAGLAALAAGSGALRHRYAVTNFLRATLVVDRQTAWHAADAGAALTERFPRRLAHLQVLVEEVPSADPAPCRWSSS